MLDKFLLRAMAESERMMDEGKIPWVWAPSPAGDGGMDRLAVNQEIMDDLELKQGQSVNTMLRDAILMISLEQLGSKLETLRERAENARMKEDFDFRTMMGDDDVPDSL